MENLADADLSGGRGASLRWLFLLCVITLVAAVLRLYGISSWPLRGDEYYTIKDGLRFFERGGSHKYPLYYFILWVLFKVTGSQSVLIARLPALVFGIAAFPLFWLYGRRIFGRHVVAVAMGILAVSQWHVYHSKIARYYSGLFLFGGLSALLLYSAVSERRPWRAFAALILGVVCAGFHPSGVFVIVGSTCYLVLLVLIRPLRPPYPVGKVIAFYLVPLGVVAVPGVIVVFRALSGWSAKGLKWNYTPAHTVLGIVRSVGLVVSLAAFAGAVVGLFKRPKMVVFLLCWLLPGIAGLVLVSPYVDVRPDYVFSVVPSCFFLAAMLCAVPFEDRTAGLSRTLSIAALTMVVACSQIPATVSDFTEKKADDPHLPAQFVKARARPSDEFIVYMTGVGPHLGRPHYRLGQFYSQQAKWKEGLQKVKDADHRTWFILSYPRAAVPAALDEWLWKHAQLLKRWRAKRFDYLTRDIEVWLYDPKWPKRQIQAPGTGPDPPKTGKSSTAEPE